MNDLVEAATDLCYRCDYDLRATPDDRPCPECGLPAGRSRRPTDELRYTRPKWLWGLAAGAILITLSLTAASVLLGPMLLAFWHVGGYWGYSNSRLPLFMGGFVVVAITFLLGIFLLSRKENYPPADQADRGPRLALRIAAVSPLVAACLALAYFQYLYDPFYTLMGNQLIPNSNSGPIDYLMQTCRIWLPATAYFFGTLGTVPLPLLLFLRLRSLAKRARSAQLSEHCTIVGVGTAATILYFTAVAELYDNAYAWGLGNILGIRSSVPLWLGSILGAFGILFALWGINLFLRFTRSFVAAARDIYAA